MDDEFETGSSGEHGMNRDGLPLLALLGVLLLSGATAWWLSLRPENRLDASVVAELPTSLNGWTAIDVEIDQDVADMLQADANLQRVYQHPHGDWVYVYIGYYGTERGGAPEHTPEVCYPAQGWTVVRQERIRLGGPRGLFAQEFVVEKGGERRLVHFWYRTRSATGITSTAALQLRNFWGRLTSNRGDGALVRLSTPIQQGDLEAARRMLSTMDTAVDTALDDVWPEEFSEG